MSIFVAEMKVLYHLILYPLSRLPESLLQGLGRFTTWILGSIVGYRKQVITTNLQNAFPDKSEDWIRKTRFAFYSNIGQIIVEAVKAFSISTSAGEKRIHCSNLSLLQELFNQGKSVALTGGHYANWEAMTLLGNRIPHDVYALYKPLKNTFMDDKVKRSREKHGTAMISIKSYRPFFANSFEVPRLYVFGIDQSPRKGKGIWMDFLNQDTAVFTGPERLAKEYDLAVVMGRMKRIARGQYELRLQLLTDKPRETAPDEITLATNKDLEAQIIEGPSDWLWSHKRWKFKRNSND